MRQYALLLLLCGCMTLSSDEADRLEAHQRNAALFYEGGKLNQALGQVERGLEVDPHDYKLNAIKGAVLLRASGNDHKLLDEATTLLAEVYDWRWPLRHEPYLLLNYGLAEQKQGLRRLGDAIRLDGQAQRVAGTAKAGDLQEEADETRTEARRRLKFADELLGYLIERGELLRVTHNHRLQIARQLGNDEAFEAYSTAFFAQSIKDQKWVEKEIERTTTPDYEREQLQMRTQLRKEEINVRALVADWHFGRKEYDKALTHMDRVLELDPQRVSDYYNRGRVHLEKQDLESAKADFRRFMGASPLPATSDKKIFAAEVLRK